MPSCINSFVRRRGRIIVLVLTTITLIMGGVVAQAQEAQPSTGSIARQIEADAHVMIGHLSTVTSVRYSPDGSLIASSSGDGVVRLWDGYLGNPVAILYGHTGPVMDVAFSPDNYTLASASMDTSVRLWGLTGFPNGEVIDVLRFDERITSVAFGTNPDLLAVGGVDGTIQLWDIPTAYNQATLLGHDEAAIALMFSPDGALLASASYDGTTRLWDMETLTERFILKPDATFKISQTDVVFSPDGRYVFTSDGVFNIATVRQWDVETGEQVASFPTNDGPESLAISPDGRTLAAGIRGIVQLWDVSSGQLIELLHGHQSQYNIKGLAFSPDGEFLVSSSEDGTLRLWQVGLLLLNSQLGLPSPLPPQTPPGTPAREPIPAYPHTPETPPPDPTAAAGNGRRAAHTHAYSPG